MMLIGWSSICLTVVASRRAAWLARQAEAEVRRAVGEHLLVSVEATGLWD